MYCKDYTLEDKEARDIAGTFGLGFGIINNSDLFDLGFKFGRINYVGFNNQIGNQSSEYIEEYIKATISIEIGEQWFLRTGSKK